MKKLTIMFLSFLLVASLKAQKIEVHEQSEDLGKGKNNALVVTIFGADENDVQHEWKKLMNNYNAKKISNSKGIMFADNTVIKEMGDNTVDIYARFDVKKDEINLVVAFDLGGAYLSSSAHPSQYKIAEKMLHDFAVKMTSEAINDKLKTQQKALDKLNGQEKDLEKDNKNLNDDITDYQGRIKKDQDAIVKNKDDQAKKQTEISNQQKVVDDLAAKAKEVK